MEIAQCVELTSTVTIFGNRSWLTKAWKNLLLNVLTDFLWLTKIFETFFFFNDVIFSRLLVLRSVVLFVFCCVLFYFFFYLFLCFFVLFYFCLYVLCYVVLFYICLFCFVFVCSVLFCVLFLFCRLFIFLCTIIPVAIEYVQCIVSWSWYSNIDVFLKLFSVKFCQISPEPRQFHYIIHLVA